MPANYRDLNRRFINLLSNYNDLEEKYNSLFEKTKDFLRAVELAPELIHECFTKIAQKQKEEREQRKQQRQQSSRRYQR